MAYTDVSVTVSTTLIDITSTNNIQVSLNDIWEKLDNDYSSTPGADDNDYMRRDANGSDWIYVINPNPNATHQYKTFDISSNCDVKFEQDDELRWLWGTASGTYNIFVPGIGANITVDEGFTFDFGYSGTYRRGYVQWYCASSLNGTVTNGIVFKNFRSFYFKAYDTQYWRYVTIKDITYSGGYLFYWSNLNSPEIDFDMEYITISNIIYPLTGGSGKAYGYVLLYAVLSELKNWTFDTFGYFNYYVFPFPYTTKFSNCTFDNLNTQLNIYNSGGVSLPYNGSKMHSNELIDNDFQPSLCFDNCVFRDMDLGSYPFQIYSQSLVTMKNCELDGTSYPSTQKGIYISGNSVLNIYGGLTYTNIGGTKITNYGSAILHSREIQITVLDLSNNPIENANIGLVQSENKERFSGLTDTNGKLLNIYGDNPLLTEKEETSYGIYTNWSDSIAGGRYHNLTVSCPGYQTEHLQIEMTEDKNITVNLTPIAKTNTIIYDSTIYDSIIN